MKRTNNWLIALLILCLSLMGCRSPLETSTPLSSTNGITMTLLPTNTPASTPTTLTVLPTATDTLLPTRTPYPSDTPTRRPITPLSPTPAPTRAPTLTPSPTPTLYVDAWASGLLWDEERTILYVGNSSCLVYDSRITYEPLNETVAAALASYPTSTLVVLYGDYTPYGPHEGHMVVKRVEQVNTPYDSSTPLSMTYTHPDHLFTFAYPDGWSLTLEADDTLSLLNRPSDTPQFAGPGLEYEDPTTVSLIIQREAMSLEAYLAHLQANERVGEDVPVDQYLAIHHSERTIAGWAITQIDEESLLWGIYRRYVLPIDEENVLVFAVSIEDAPFAERLLATLVLNAIQS